MGPRAYHKGGLDSSCDSAVEDDLPTTDQPGVASRDAGASEDSVDYMDAGLGFADSKEIQQGWEDILGTMQDQQVPGPTKGSLGPENCGTTDKSLLGDVF